MSTGEEPRRDPRAPPASVAAAHRRTSTARGRRGRGLASVAELVPRVLKNEPEDAVLFRVMAIWERSLPHRMVKNARPTAFRKGVLYVAATTSAWAQEIALRSTEILEKLRRGAPRAGIASLRVRTGRLPDRIVPPPRLERRVIPLAKLPDVLAVPLENLADPKLRELFVAAIRTSICMVVEVASPREPAGSLRRVQP
jgi:predicted nucleic acid-binding Zn ribbon protein